jgi:carbonic anhydrase/acetyltransferase-like protein (isoleucine patch superfamily)
VPNIRPFRDHRPQIADDAWIDTTAVVIGEVSIGPRSSIWPMCVVRGDIHRIEIGSETNIQDGSVLHVSHDSRFLPGGAPLILHDRITVGHQVVLHGCEIEDLCLIGIGVRRARALTDREQEYLEYTAAHYVRLAEAHRHSDER